MSTDVHACICNTNNGNDIKTRFFSFFMKCVIFILVIIESNSLINRISQAVLTSTFISKVLNGEIEHTGVDFSLKILC